MKKPIKKRGMLLRINADAHKALKMIAVEDERTLSSIGVEALNDFLKKRGKKVRVIDFSK